MSSTVSSVFSTDLVSDHPKLEPNIDLTEILRSSSSSKSAPVITSALNICYTKALLSLHQHIEELHSQSAQITPHGIGAYNVSENDFDASVFPGQSLSPSAITISQWRHEQFFNEKFSRLLIAFVIEDMYAIVLRWIELELSNEQARGSRNKKRKYELQQQRDELIFEKDTIDIPRLYQLSGDSKDILIEQVEWKSVATKMRSKGNFKYFDESSLKRLWLHQCQYGLDNTWSEEEDQLLNELVQENGYGKWMEIAQHDTFQKTRKSAYMCAQRYMTKTNKTHSKRRFTKPEKDLLVSMHQHRCLIVKDYRFCVSYAAYVLADRCIRQISHIWIRLNREIQKKPFTPEEDQILLEQTSQTSSICWSTIASNHFPDRSGTQCRQRYQQITKPPKSTNKKCKCVSSCQ